MSFTSRCRAAVVLGVLFLSTGSAGALAQAGAPAAPASAAAPSALAELERVREESRIPGVAAAVLSGDSIVFSGAAGFADVEAGVKATPLTKFRLGSVSKPLTATLAAKLARQGKLDLDRDVRGYVPSWPDKGTPITLRQLLGHFGGIRHYAPKDFDRRQPGGPIDLRLYPDTDSMLAIFKDDPLVAPPGSKSSYSTFGYTLAAAAIEGATGRRFADVMSDELLQPLGLEREIVVDDIRAIIPHRAAPYDLAGDGEAAPPRSVVRAWPMNPAYKIAGGGYLSSAEALARFGGAVFAPGRLDRETLDLLFREQATPDGKAAGIGLGWRLGRDSDGRRLLHHSGSQLGCRAHLVVYPDEKLSVAFLSNLTNVPDAVAPVGERLASHFLPPKPR